MRRTTLLSTATAALVAMTVLPSIGAAAAEPLGDGDYAFTVGEQEFVFAVTDGDATELEGATFRTDADGNVLDELTFVLGEDVYEVVFEDGVPQVALVDDGSDVVDGDGAGDDVADDGDDDDVAEDGEDVIADEDGDGEVVEDVDGEDGSEDDEAVGSTKGELVSAVAACAPRGREARELGWPNHGTFVSAAARGEEALTWTVVDEAGATELTASFLGDADVAAFCALVDEAVAGPVVEPEADAEEPTTDEPTTDEPQVDEPASDEPEAAEVEAEKARGRSGETPGRSGEAPGRSGEAPGRNKDRVRGDGR